MRTHFQHDVILVQLRKHSGDLPLPKSVVERIVDGLRQDAQSRSRVAIDDQVRLQSVVLLVAGHVAQLRHGLELLQKLLRPGGQFSGIGVFHRILVLGAADAAFHSQVLHRLHVERDAFHFGQFRLQIANDLGSSLFTLIARLQIDLDAAAVRRDVRAIDADKRSQVVDVRIL